MRRALCLLLFVAVACVAAHETPDYIVPETEIALEALQEVNPLPDDELVGSRETVTDEAAPKGVKHFKKQCWAGCKKKQGCGCSYCGPAGICCRMGWHDHKNGCNGKIGGRGMHQCVKAPKGVCKKKKKKKVKKPKKKKKPKKSPFTGKLLPKKKTPVKFRVSLHAKSSGAYQAMLPFVTKMMKDGTRAKGSKGFFECKIPAKRQIVFYEDWESIEDLKAFSKAMKGNFKTLVKSVLRPVAGISHVKVKSIPSKAYFCKVWAPKLKGKISFTRKNAAVLKAFSVLAADKVLDSHSIAKGPIGALIVKMAAKIKMSPEVQFAYAISQLRSRFSAGVPKYVLTHIAKAMAGPNGVIVVGPVFGKDGNWVHLNDASLGLSGASFQLVSKIAVRPGEFTMALGKIDSKAIGARLQRYRKKQAQLTVKDFHTLFAGKCVGGPSCRKHGQRLPKKLCLKNKYCQWSTGWDGD